MIEAPSHRFRALLPRPLLDGAIDYAGLFPPAELGMGDAVANFLSYRSGPEAWALGRFVLPVARLAEFERALPSRATGGHLASIELSALIGSGTTGDVDTVAAFNRGTATHGARIESVEVKAGSAGAAQAVLDAIPCCWLRYVEVPLGSGLPEVLDVLVAGGGLTKIRTGGTSPEAIPSAGALAAALVALAERKLSFKATAGLHHPITGSYPLTYRDDAPRGVMFGYLNLMAAAGLAWEGAALPVVERALLELDSASPGAMARARPDFFHGFGSCSFREPLDEFPGVGGTLRA